MIQQQFVALGTALEQAAQNDDWLQVMQIDKQINDLLLQLRHQSLSEVTLAQVKTLQQRHQQVAAQCRSRVDELRHKLQQHQSQRQGMQAYSLFGDEVGGA
jgi:predicted lactoylglutathione lyase